MNTEPFVRNDKRGKWRTYNGDVLTVYSWDTLKQAVEWCTWNNFGRKPDFVIYVRNSPNLPDKLPHHEH